MIFSELFINFEIYTFKDILIFKYFQTVEQKVLLSSETMIHITLIVKKVNYVIQ